MKRKKTSFAIMLICILSILFLPGCGNDRNVKVKYNICSEEYNCDSKAMGEAATPVHFYMPKDHGAIIITFVTSETFGFTSDMSDALTDFPKPFGEIYTVNTEIMDLVLMAMSSIEVGMDVAIMQYSINDRNNIMRVTAEDISGYQAGHYYYTVYDSQNNVLFDGLMPEGKTTLALSDNVDHIDIYSYIGSEFNDYFPNGTIPGTVAYENAYEIDSSNKDIDIDDIVKYEDLNIFEKAKELGYDVAEIEEPSYYFAVSFVLDKSTSICVYDRKLSKSNISLFSNGSDTSYLSAVYNDKMSDTRDSDGHWNFSDKHKKELIHLLSEYKSKGIIAFSNLYSDANGYLDGELKTVVEDLGLVVRYQKYELNDRQMYNFYFFDNNGRSAWFPAVYSEGDFRPNEQAYTLNKWENGEGDATYAYFSFQYDFAIDYVDKDHILNTEPERNRQIYDFFSGNI